jgi:hypothetical protein
MNTAAENVTQDQPKPNSTTMPYQDHDIYPLGTFAGTIYKVCYFLNGSFAPSDTSDQLIPHGLK